MLLKSIFSENKDRIIERWTGMVHGTYPFGTIGFLRTQANPFVNPVGRRTGVAAETFVDSLLSGERDLEKITGVMEEFMRVRAVQDFSAENAVGVIFALKQAFREVFDAEIETALKSAGPERVRDFFYELLALESDLDALALLAFGSYVKHRELLSELRINEFKRRHSQIIRQAERVLEQKFPEHR